MTGLQTLIYKEVLRFWKVAFQTIGGPVLNAMLYLLIFGHALQDHVKVYDKVDHTCVREENRQLDVSTPLTLSAGHLECRYLSGCVKRSARGVSAQSCVFLEPE